MTERAHAYVASVLLTLGFLLATPAHAGPSVVDEGFGIERATWDFRTTGDYSANNATLAPEAASLARETNWRNYTTDGDFDSAHLESVNTTVDSGIRLAGNVTNLVVDGTFDTDPGPWSYTSGASGAVTAAWESVGRARLGHETTSLKLDSMDDIFGPYPWVSVTSGPGHAISNVSQETTIRAEGNGSLKNDVTILVSGPPVRWGGVMRNDPGFWDLTAYNRMGIRMRKETPGPVAGFVEIEDAFGANSVNLLTPITTWFRYAIDLNASINLAVINFIRIGFQGAPVGIKSTMYIDDIVLFNATEFSETAHFAQTFSKPFATGAEPGAIGLRFDLEATQSTNVDSELAVSLNSGVEWSERPVTDGLRTIEVDLSDNLALRGTGSFILKFSLMLDRTGWEESSMTAWIDNVRLVASYGNGSFTSAPLDAGSAADWGVVSLTATRPAGTGVFVETRTGNSTNPGDPYWAPWQALLQNETQSPPNRYLQWRLLLVPKGTETPVASRMGITYAKYAAAGEIRAVPFLPTKPLVSWRQFLASDSAPDATAVTYDVSHDGGATWIGAATGQDLSPLPTSSIIVRATLRTSNTTIAPSIASWSLRYEVATSSGPPRIDGVVPDQLSQEDGPSWSLDLIPFAQNQTDPADTLANLKWYITEINTNLYTVQGANVFGQHALTFAPLKDAYGTDGAILWLEDRDGARSSQPLQVTIQPVNDEPVWLYVPEVWVLQNVPYTLFLPPYVADVDTPAKDLVFSTSDPARITTSGPNATYAFPGPKGVLLIRHEVSDGLGTSIPVMVTIHVTDHPPPEVRRPIPDLTITEDVKAYDVFRPESLSDYFLDVLGEPLILTSNFTNLDVELWNDGLRIRVNVSATPNFCGMERITFRARDSRNAFAEYTNTVTVTCVNDPPVLGWRHDVYVRFDAAYVLHLSPFIFDVDDPMDALSLTTSDPVHARVNQFSINFVYPRAEFGPNPVSVPLQVILTDGKDTYTASIRVFVSDNRPPEIVRAFEEVRFPEDTVATSIFDLPLHFADDRDLVLEYRVDTTIVNVTTVSGLVTLRPPPNWFGQDTLVIRAVDSGGAFALANVPIHVLPVNDPPVLGSLPAQVRDRGGHWILDLRPFVDDVDNDVFELTFTTNSPRVDAVGYLLVFNYSEGSASEDVIVTASDPGHKTTSAILSVRFLPSIWPFVGGAVVAVSAVAFVAGRAWTRRRYAIEDFMIIGHEGILIAHTTRRERAGPDSDIMAAMLTATLIFIRDSYREDKDELQRFELSHDRVGIVQKGAHVYGVAMAVGRVPDASYLGLKGFLDELEERYGDRLAAQVGAFNDVLPGLTGAMSRFARRGRYRFGDFDRSARQGIRWPLRRMEKLPGLQELADAEPTHEAIPAKPPAEELRRIGP